MKHSVILSIMGILIVGMNFGYYQPKIKNYEVEVTKLTSEVTSQKAKISTQATQISTTESEKHKLEQAVSAQKNQITTQTTQISTLTSDKAKLQTDLSQARAQAQDYIGQVSTLTSEVSSSQKRLDNVLGITITQGYQWTYLGQNWDWTFPILLSIYLEYHDRPRPQLVSTWIDMAKDPKDDAYIDQIVNKINEATSQRSFTEIQKLNFVADFVQSLPYTVDSVTSPYNEYPRYPIETLFDRGGDCEDTSILVAAILNRMGYDVALLLLRDAKHMAVGISTAGNYGSYYTYKDKKYYYLETTGAGWQIGEIPPEISATRATVYPLRP